MDKLSKLKSWLVRVGLLVAAAVLVKQTLLAPPAVAVVRVERRDLTAQVYGNGTVEAKVVVGVSSKISGRLVEVLVDQGDRVKAGQLLARLESDDFVQQVQQARAMLSKASASVRAEEASLQKALATRRLAATNAQRFRALVAEDLVSRLEAEQYDTAASVATDEVGRNEASLAAAREERSAAQAALGLAETRLADTLIHAPQDGVIVSRDLEQGSTVAPGLPIFTLADPTTVWVKANVDEAMLSGLAVESPAAITLRSAPRAPIPGRVARLARQSDRVTEELEVDVAFDAARPDFRLGEQADVLITTATRSQATALPSAAVIRRQGKRGVWLVTAGRLHFTEIGCGIEDREGLTEVSSGLSDGAQVAMAPAPTMAKFKDGMAVRAQ